MNVSRETLRSRLLQGLLELGLDLQPQQIEQLLDYQGLMSKWNKVYNLTAIRDPEQMLALHLLDSLSAVAAFAKAKRVLDVGAGGGLPGIVLAIARPDVQVHLIDVVQKKTAFLNQVKAELKLVNVNVHCGKVENLQTGPDLAAFDIITSRAFADLRDFVSWSGHLLTADGEFIALKGQDPLQESQALPAGWRVKTIQALRVPQLDAARHLVFIERA
ncbi:16S rRNA (guanine(527)-N(7))-methyltransferase RsmG [Massilia sp. W12]|uniref:16S rRNA (guanine(527)-N(7))-methyltransferase RsmG n=1 Tax=Massilia sp. W12 TaxID=3126507 RepID=UPI0030D5D29D